MKLSYIPKKLIVFGDKGIEQTFPDIGNILTEFDCQDSLAIHVGDCGIGFPSYNDNYEEELQLQELDNQLIELNTELLIIRGNHDNPNVWSNRDFYDYYHNYQKIKFLEDYTLLEIKELKFLFFGGGVSLDRIKRHEGLKYWKEEIINYPDDVTIDGIIDFQPNIIISHTSPLSIRPPEFIDSHILNYHLKLDPTLSKDIKEEESKLQLIYNCLNRKEYTTLWFYGHFHKDKTYLNGEKNIFSRCVGEGNFFIEDIETLIQNVKI